LLRLNHRHKLQMIGVFRDLCPQLGTMWQNDMHWAYFDGHRAGSRHAWNMSGKAGKQPGWEADEGAAGRNADSAMYEDLRKRAGDGMYARLEETLEEMEALTAWLGFARFCAQEMGLEAEKLLEALGRPFAEGVRDLGELSVRHEVEAEAKGAEEYLAIMTEKWRRGLESA
jgi:hypothetical protein